VDDLLDVAAADDKITKQQYQSHQSHPQSLPTVASWTRRFAAVCCGLQRRHVANRGQPWPTVAKQTSHDLLRFAAVCNVGTSPTVANRGQEWRGPGLLRLRRFAAVCNVGMSPGAANRGQRRRGPICCGLLWFAMPARRQPWPTVAKLTVANLGQAWPSVDNCDQRGQDPLFCGVRDGCGMDAMAKYGKGWCDTFKMLEDREHHVRPCGGHARTKQVLEFRNR
jgi:hypothetical protein